MTVLPSEPGTEERGDDRCSAADLAWARLSDRIEVRTHELELIVSRLFERSLSESEITQGMEVAAAVSSAYGILGLVTSSELIRNVQESLAKIDPGVQDAVLISGLLEDARTTAAMTASEIMAQRQWGARVAIVGDSSELVDTLVWVAIVQGMNVIRVAEGQVSEVGEPGGVAAVLLVYEGGSPGSCRAMVRGSRSLFPTQPVIAVLPMASPVEMAWVASAATLIMPPSVHPDEIVAELRKSLTRASHELSVGLIGDERAELARSLEERGFITAEFSTPAQLVEAAANDWCRSVVIGTGIDGFSDLDVLRLIRTDRRSRSTVVAVMASDPTEAWSKSMLRSGADLSLPGDVDCDDLSLWLRSLLRRRSEIEPVATTEHRVGLTRWGVARVAIERMMMASFRRHQPIGVGVVRLPSIDQDEVNLDRLIASEFRNEDVISRMDDETLVVVLRGVDEETMERRMRQIHKKFRLGEYDGRIAVVGFPTDGRSIQDLVSTAKEVVADAEASDGPGVVGKDWASRSVERADILMVDPDETLGAVLASALGRRGISVEVQPDATDALDHLTGVSGKPLPKVVLLELDLYGLDGLQVLRSMRDAGTIKKIKVIVLSSRSRESDLRQAFEFGVDDYVSKPFSAPLLMHRLGRVLELL